MQFLGCMYGMQFLGCVYGMQFLGCVYGMLFLGCVWDAVPRMCEGHGSGMCVEQDAKDDVVVI